MRAIPFALLFVAFVYVTSVSATEPIGIRLHSLEEQPGRIAATISVFGPDGRPIVGLGTPNFKASLNETPLNVSDLLGSAQARQPASVVLIVDVSGSMGGDPITQAKAAMQDFVRTLDPGDRVAIVTFGTRVTLLQDFTSDRNVLYQSISRINAAGQTAMYEGVLEGLGKIGEAPPGRRMVVLLSDGGSDAGRGRRSETLEAAAATGVNIHAVALGSQADRSYLNELVAASGGSLIQANSSVALRQAYADIANAIRAQYTVVMAVPSTLDRTQSAKLRLQVSLRGDSGAAEWDLWPLAGAVAPAFELKLAGVKAGDKVRQAGKIVLAVEAPPGVNLGQVDFLLDGQTVHSATTPPFSFELDASSLAMGSHVIAAQASAPGGRGGQTQVAFTIAAPAKSGPVSGTVIIVFLVLGVGAALAYFVVRKRPDQLRSVASRISLFAPRSDGPIMRPIEDWPAPPAPPSPRPVAPAADQPRGRVVVLDEAAVRNGNLDAIREFEIKSQPLILGSGPACDIQLEDPQGRIAAEEARLWVQKGRLVYHKLTTLSAMATEGVTSGWEFLESGEEMSLGPYRILFEEYRSDQAELEDDVEPVPDTAEPLKPVQEHGMTLTDLWSRVRDDTHAPQPSE